MFRTEESGRDRTRIWGDGNEVLGWGVRDRERGRREVSPSMEGKGGNGVGMGWKRGCGIFLI